MSPKTTLTVELPVKTHDQLKRLVAKFGRDKTAFALEALRKFLDYEDWKSEEVRKGIDQADTGQFASDAEVEAVFSKWT